MEISRKMNLATVNNLRKGLKNVTASEFVARFFGVVSSVVAEPTAGGSAQWKFTGEFQGVSADGKEHAAPVLYLPSPADSALAAVIKAAGSKPVKFAYDLFAEPDAGHVLGYALNAVPLITPAALDSLADVKSALPAVPLKMAEKAPEAKPESEAPKAEERTLAPAPAKQTPPKKK
jgi:hypothetical protein